MVLPDLERQRSIEELSRLVLGLQAEVQREAPAPAPVAGPGGEGPMLAHQLTTAAPGGAEGEHGGEG